MQLSSQARKSLILLVSEKSKAIHCKRRRHPIRAIWAKREQLKVGASLRGANADAVFLRLNSVGDECARREQLPDAVNVEWVYRLIA
jgi:hypothetical protein